MIDKSCTWDEEAIATAEAQAALLETSDPEAAHALRAQAQYVKQQKAPQDSSYNPMRLYARLAKYYHFSHHDMEHMHFPTFFAYVQEAEIMLEEERVSMRTTRAPLSPVEADNFLHQNFSTATPYTGEVVTL